MITIGVLIMFNSYANAFFQPLRQLGNSWQRIKNVLATTELAEELLQTPQEIYVPKNAVILTKLQGGITFKDVIFSYNKKDNKVLDGMSFEIKPGERVAFVGGSGEGKSTIVDLICGFWFAENGKVLIDGHNVRNLDLKSLRSQIAAVPQEVALFNDTIGKNIAYGSFSATDAAIATAAHEAYADEFIDSFPKKYDQMVGERGVKLSGGQKQRLAIARAILRDPKILVLDEPTSALDAKSENFIKVSLEKLMEGRTTIIIAHRLSTVRKADKIMVLSGGRIAEQGKHDELIQIPNGIYRELYELQVGLHE
jgi:ABC-type multidrug transport system fused ATPase/permease subunit